MYISDNFFLLEALYYGRHVTLGRIHHCNKKESVNTQIPGTHI